MLLMRAASITRASGMGLGPENRDFLGPVKWHRADMRVPFGAQRPLQCAKTGSINSAYGKGGGGSSPPPPHLPLWLGPLWFSPSDSAPSASTPPTPPPLLPVWLWHYFGRLVAEYFLARLEGKSCQGWATVAIRTSRGDDMDVNSHDCVPVPPFASPPCQMSLDFHHSVLEFLNNLWGLGTQEE